MPSFLQFFWHFLMDLGGFFWHLSTLIVHSVSSARPAQLVGGGSDDGGSGGGEGGGAGQKKQDPLHFS